MNALIINCSSVKIGATQEIVNIVSKELKTKHEVKSICIDDFSFNFCKGCRSSHNTANVL